MYVYRGDGIGPEVIAEAKRVLNKTIEKYSHNIVYKDTLMGGHLLMHMVIVRELTGDLYFGERHTKEVNGVITAVDTLSYSEKEIHRVAVKAFEIAMRRSKKVTNVDKVNVLDSSRLWRKNQCKTVKQVSTEAMGKLIAEYI